MTARVTVLAAALALISRSAAAQVVGDESLPHVVGFAEADGWAANIDFMTDGPYMLDVPTRARVAA